MDLLKLWWESPRNWWKIQWKMENHGTMAYCSIGPHPSALLFHHHWRCWQEEDHIQPFHSFHWVLVRTWKPPGFENCLGGNPTLPQEPTWIWTLDNLSLSRKWVETFGKLLLLINQQLSLIHIGWGFQTIPYWEGPGQWSNPGLYLLISSCRLKPSHGTLKEKPTHILMTPSTSWMETQCCLLHQWQVWPLQQQLIGTAKSGNQLILSFPQRHPSLPWVDLVFLQHQDVPPDPPKVFHQMDTPHPRSDCLGIHWMFHLCRTCSKSVGLLVSSVSSTDLWNMELRGIFLTFSVFQILL